MYSYRKGYARLGALLGMGAPVGLLLVRWLFAGEGGVGSWLAHEIPAHAGTYLYLALTAPLVLACFGWLLGRKDEQLRLLNITDVLTGLYSYRFFNTRLVEAVEHGRRYEEPVALLMLDLDNLKAINDHHGHLAGHRALQTCARAIADSIRSTDVAGRVGGDEFAVLLPHTSATAAEVVAERIRQAAEQLATGLPLTVSIGVADSTYLATPTACALMDVADSALYQAKAAGRNRVVVAAQGRSEVVEDRAFRRILVPVDFSPCARSALLYALFLAAADSSSVDVVHVTGQRKSDPPAGDGPPPSSRSMAVQSQLDALVDSVTAEGRGGRWIQRWVQPSPAGPAATILELAAGDTYDLICLGTHGREGLQQLFMGSVAAQVVRRARCPVVTIRIPTEEAGAHAAGLVREPLPPPHDTALL